MRITSVLLLSLATLLILMSGKANSKSTGMTSDEELRDRTEFGSKPVWSKNIIDFEEKALGTKRTAVSGTEPLLHSRVRRSARNSQFYRFCGRVFCRIRSNSCFRLRSRRRRSMCLSCHVRACSVKFF